MSPTTLKIPACIDVQLQPAGHWSWICTKHAVGTVSAIGADRTALDNRIREHLWTHGQQVPLW